MSYDFCDRAVVQELETRLKAARDIDIVPIYWILCPFMILTCLVSIVLNGLLINVSRRNKSVHKSPILLLSLNLAFTDLLSSIFSGINIILNSFIPEVFKTPLHPCFMLVLENFRCAALVASALHLLALALVHYRGIVNPLHYR